MSAIGDYIYYTARDYEKGVSPPNLYNTALKQSDAIKVFQAKKYELASHFVTGRQNQVKNKENAKDVAYYLNLANAYLTSNQRDTFSFKSADEANLIKNFTKAFENQMQKENISSDYYQSMSTFNALISQGEKELYDLSKVEEKTTEDWQNILKRIDKLFSDTDKQAVKYVKGTMGKSDISYLQNNIKQLINLLEQGSRITEKKILSFQQANGNPIGKKEQEQLKKWIRRLKSGNSSFGAKTKDADSEVFHELRYLSHILSAPSTQIYAKVGEIFTGAMKGILAFGSAEMVEKYCDDIFSGTKMGSLYVKKAELGDIRAREFYELQKKNPELVKTFFNDKHEEIAVFHIRQSQNKADVTIPIYENGVKRTEGTSVKVTSANEIKGITQGVFYNLIANDNQNNFINHYINIFAPKVTQPYLDDNNRGSIISLAKQDSATAKVGNEAMRGLLLYRGFTGENIAKMNNNSAQYLSIYRQGIGWDFVTFFDLFYQEYISTQGTFTDLGISITGRNASDARLYNANIFALNILPYDEQKYYSDKIASIIRTRVNQTLDKIHQAKVTLVLKNIDFLLKQTKGQT